MNFTIDEKRTILINIEFENMMNGYLDKHTIREIIENGYKGYNQISDEDINTEFNQLEEEYVYQTENENEFKNEFHNYLTSYLN